MLIKKILLSLFFIASFIFLAATHSFAYNNFNISAESAVVVNADTLEVIFEKNAEKKMSMASTTKIMTSVIAIESGRLNNVVTVNGISAEGSSVGLKNGDVLTLKSLVYAMMLESGNDAAQATANYLADTEESFSSLMNKKAVLLGMKSTNFVTASGLDAESHYSTAYDMAVLGSYAIKNPVFRNICSDSKETVEMISPDVSLYMNNHNKLLGNCNGVFGIKTGFTKKSGRCLVTACERNGVTLVAVTLNAPDDWNDHIKLYDRSFAALKTNVIDIDLPESISIYGSEKTKIRISAYSNKYKYSYLNMNDVKIEVVLPTIIYAPIKKGDIVGQVNFTVNNSVVHCESIFSLDSANSIEGKDEPETNILKKLYKLLFNERIKNYDRRKSEATEIPC